MDNWSLEKKRKNEVILSLLAVSGFISNATIMSI
jgi:hypothetical protein